MSMIVRTLALLLVLLAAWPPGAPAPSAVATAASRAGLH